MQKKMRKSKKKWIVVSAATAGVMAVGAPSVVAADSVGANAQEAVLVAAEGAAPAATTAENSAPSSAAPVETPVSPAESTPAQASAPVAPAADEVKEAAPVEKAAVKPAEAVVTSQSAAPAPAQVEPATLGLSKQAYEVAKEAGLDLANLTEAQKVALNRVRKDLPSNSGTLITYKNFEDIATSLVNRDSRYAIPYFNASQIENMPAARTRNAQTGEVADLDVWDSWPVQDAQTGHIVNWNGYQLVIAMMGLPHENDQHIYLLYNKYGDNNFANWKNAG